MKTYRIDGLNRAGQWRWVCMGIPESQIGDAVLATVQFNGKWQEYTKLRINEEKTITIQVTGE